MKIFDIDKDSNVLTDQMVVVGGSSKRMENVFLLVELDETKGNRLRLITNRFDISAEELSDMYRTHWIIELFFKGQRLKQHVKIKYFYGQSETAIEN